MAGAGTDSLQYKFTTAAGCSAVAGQTIIVYPKPTADAGPDRTVLEGGSITLEGSGTGNNISYLWLPDSAMDNNKIATPKVSPANDILYTLLVTSADGCVDSSHVLVTVLKKPVVPNAFSPNGDGINDTWVIKYLDTYPGADISVFNRYGQLVYHNTGYTKAWDGTYNGKPLPVATYYWIIDPKNGRAQMSGSVTIIR
jgi:gliding motility-associated-like protein